jgi:7-carboxy-7-deazaguanine synthase
MRIAEIFRSLQGEGRLTGTPSVFVRTSGCLLRCRFCDTRYASWEPEGETLSVEQILAQAEEVARATDQGPEVEHIVITGGEPMMTSEIVPLATAFRQRGKHITIETAGTRYQPVACDLMSISPKLSNSIPTAEQGWGIIDLHQRRRYVPAVIRRLNAEYDCQFKFVVDCPADCEEVLAYLADFPEIDRNRVMLMPQGVDAEGLEEKAAWLEPYCAETGLQFCPRRHVGWFGGGRGT